MSLAKTVSFHIKLPAKVTKRKKWYLASCPILDVHSQGATQKQAKRNLEEALTLFFVSCLERKTLDAVLKDCGFSVAQVPIPHGKKQIVSQKDYIDVPIPLLVSRSHHNTCHA
jgi:predicted RNase H-like HicB family nuclease